MFIVVKYSALRFDEMSTNLRKHDVGTARRGVGARRAEQRMEATVFWMWHITRDFCGEIYEDPIGGQCAVFIDGTDIAPRRTDDVLPLVR